MARGLEEHCVDYLLGLTEVSTTKLHRQECIRLWREKYGDKFAAEVRRKAWARLEEKRK